MAEQTQTQQVPPAVLPGEQIYALIMVKIEPELLPESLAGLTQKYAEETPEQKQARADRYTKAFAEYEVQLKKYDEDWHAKLRTYKRLAISSLEQKLRGKEDVDLTNLESSILAA